MQKVFVDILHHPLYNFKLHVQTFQDPPPKEPYSLNREFLELIINKHIPLTQRLCLLHMHPEHLQSRSSITTVNVPTGRMS